MTYPPQGSDDGRSTPPPWGANQPYGPPPQPPPAYGPPPQYAKPAPQYGPPAPYGQPPRYGVPQYPAYGPPGQQFGPPPPPARTSKVGLIAVLTAVALVVIAGVVVLVMRLQSTVLDASSAERDVAAQFEQREGVAIDLTCPSDMEVRTGATYTCTGTTDAGESVTLKLTITNARTAAYTWAEP